MIKETRKKIIKKIQAILVEMNLKKKKIRKNQRKIGNKLIIYNIYYLKLILINYIFIDIIIYYVYHHQNNILYFFLILNLRYSC